MDLVKLIILMALATLCHSQAGSGDITTPVDPEMRRYNGTRAYRTAASYQELYSNGIYENTESYRLAHYNCHVRASNGTIINRLPSEYIFSVYLQMPVLHFLNVDYKTALMNSIAVLLGVNLATAMSPPICVDGYDQVYVGEFEEGVLLRLYLRPVTIDDAPVMMGRELEQNFMMNLGIGRPHVTSFEGETALNYSRSDRFAVVGRTWSGRYSINIGGCRQLNPMYNFFQGNYTQNLRCFTLDNDDQDDLKDNLAENPDPVNQYLEAGDYVFAVLGSIAVAIVLGLALLGYFIHPFFLA